MAPTKSDQWRSIMRTDDTTRRH